MPLLITKLADDEYVAPRPSALDIGTGTMFEPPMYTHELPV